MTHLDQQMQVWAPRLRDDLGVSIEASNSLATSIAAEVRVLGSSVVAELEAASPIAIATRLDELLAFQSFMDLVHDYPMRPDVVRAQVIVQNYICFVYLGDACFRILKRASTSGSTVKRCCRFLTDNPVRAFRNATAHGNWRYNGDFSGLEFWSRKGSDPSEPLARFEVSQNELGFWQALARCTAYAVYSEVGAS